MTSYQSLSVSSWQDWITVCVSEGCAVSSTAGVQPTSSIIFNLFVCLFFSLLAINGVSNCTRDTTWVSSLFGGQTAAPQLYMHQSADQILVVVVLMFVICAVIITRCNVIYFTLCGNPYRQCSCPLGVVSLLLWRRGRGRTAFWNSNTWKVSV